MSESDDKEIPSGVQRPVRALQHTAPGVFGARELPKQHSTTSLSTGDVVGGRFEVSRYLGSSGGGISYLCNDASTKEEVVIKVLAMAPPSKQRFESMYDQVRTASAMDHKNLTKILGMGRTPSGEAFVAMEFVKGATLSSIIAKRREEGGVISLRDAFTLIAHVCNALDIVHTKTAHYVLTPYNIYLERRGVVRVGNLAFGKLAGELLLERGEGPFTDSIYVAPEVSEAPDMASSASDIYSLGMLTAEMLSPQGLAADRDEARVQIVSVLASYPPALTQLVMRSIGEDLAGRPRSAAAFRETFQKICEADGMDLLGPPLPGGLPIEPAIERKTSESDIFDIPELAGLGAEPSDAANERYLVQKGGLDYGPFSPESVLEQLYKDEIDEFTQVLDRVTQKRVPLVEMERFKKDVNAYIPKREERRRIEAAQRAELQRKVKKGGVVGLVVSIVVGLSTLITMAVLYVLQPDPEKLPMERAFASLDYKFMPPPKDFQTLAVDTGLLNSLFNPKASEEEIEKALKTRTKTRRPTASGKRPTRAEDGTEVQELDFASEGGSQHILTDQDVNDVILSNFGGLRSCVIKEIQDDPRFKGVTVQFFIRPTGTTGGVKIKEERYRDRPVAECLTTRFRGMKFPEHAGLNRGVEFPLLVQ